MTENVTLEIIKTVGIIITAILSLVGLIYTVKGNKKQDIIHNQINGMQDKLVSAEKSTSNLEGNREGRAELKQEQDIDNNKT